MIDMKRLVALLALLLSLGLSLAQQEAARIVVITHGTAADPFWSVVKNGVDQAAADMGAQVEYRAPQTFDMIEMAQLIDAAVASQPDGMVVTITDPDALETSLRRAVENGIPLISINTGSDFSAEFGALAHVGQEEYLAGVGAGERMAQEGVEAAVCVNHEVGNVALDQRCEGFAEGLGGSVEVLSVQGEPTEIQNAILAFLNNNPDLGGMLTLGPVGADPALAALQQGGRLEEVNFGTFDLSPAILEALDEGLMDFAIDQQQYLQGYLPIVMLSLYDRYGLLPANDVVLTGPGFVTPENAAQVIELSEQGIR